MKASSFLNWKTTLVVASVPFVAAWFQSAASSASGGDMASADAPSETVAASGATNSADTSASSNTDFVTTPDATGATQSSPTPVPAGMKLYAGTAEVVKLAQAGVSDDVILAYITNANVRFGVNSDQIIYLNDLGVSGTVVTAMMQHDATANALAASAASNPSPAMATANAPTPGVDYANPPMPTTDDNGMATPPPDNSDYMASYTGDGQGDGSVADDTGYFYNPLQPYGTWLYVVGSGLCWQPTVCVRDHAWRPYCDRGRWLYSNCGWYWQSDYSWGWAAFHYGRWFCDNRRGWCWQPNRVWGPSWVAWRQSSDHCGWAPLPPSAVFVPGGGFRFHNQAVGANFDFGLPAGLFTFIPIERCGDYAPSRYAAAPWQAGRIFSESRALNSVAFQGQRVANLGMDPRLVDARAGVRMRRAVIQEIPGTDANGRMQPDRLGRQGGSLVIYRPQLPPAPDRHGRGSPAGPSTGGAGVGMPRQNNFTPIAGGTRTSLNSPPSLPDRTPTVLGRNGVPSTLPAGGAEGASHVQVYYATHENPGPAGTYPPNSTGLDGRRNVSNPQWKSTPGQAPSGPQNNNYRPGSTSSYTVTPGAAGQNESPSTRPTRVTVYGSTAGYQQYGNPYYRTPVMGVATPNPGTTYVPPGYNNYRQSGYNQGLGSSYRTPPQPGASYSAPVPRESYSPPSQNYSAPQPGRNYSAPAPRQNYNAPQPRETYSASQPQQTYSAPASQQTYSAPAQSSSHSSSSYSQQSQSSSSSGSSRGR
jgi:hypothetical protein